ncbi:hypothetical protein QL285_008900 [Trifolium repens]|nr:hypothetical protein QL285_008900 [Trifolium repens]
MRVYLHSFELQPHCWLVTSQDYYIRHTTFTPYEHCQLLPYVLQTYLLLLVSTRSLRIKFFAPFACFTTLTSVTPFTIFQDSLTRHSFNDCSSIASSLRS